MTEVDIAAVLQLGDCSYQDQQIGVYAYQKNMSYDEALDEIYSHVPRECQNTYGNTKEEVAWGYWNEYKEKMGICLNESLNKCDYLMSTMEEQSQDTITRMEQYAEDHNVSLTDLKKEVYDSIPELKRDPLKTLEENAKNYWSTWLRLQGED